MINTIFYFAESLSLEDYISQVQSGEISPKTIVLASELKSIYKGGRMFGKTSYEDLKSEIERMFGNDDSSLIRRYIQDLIDNKSYDDTSLRNALSEVNNSITNLNNTADNELARLTELINTFNAKALNLVETLLSDPSWVLNNLPKETPTWQSGWNENLRAYLSTVGYWDGEGNDWSAKYSEIVQNVNSLSSTVTSIQNSQYDGSFVTEVMRSEINLAIENGLASLDLSTTFTQVLNDIDKAKQVIQWLYSGLRSNTNSNNYTTFSSLYAAGSDGISSGLSEIRSEVQKLKTGKYLATSSVESAVDEAISALYNKVTTTHASAEVFSTIKNNYNAIAGLTTDVLDINNAITGINQSISTASLVARLGQAESGLVLKNTYTTLYDALSGRVTTNANSIATLTAQIEGLSSGVTLDVQLAIQLATAGLVAQADVNNGTIAASIMALVNAATGSSLKLNASRIDLTGTTFALDVIAQGISTRGGLYLTGVDITDNNITVKTGSYGGGNPAYNYTTITGDGITGGRRTGTSTPTYSWLLTSDELLFKNGLSLVASGTNSGGTTLTFSGTTGTHTGDSGEDKFVFNGPIKLGSGSSISYNSNSRTFISNGEIDTDVINIGDGTDEGGIVMGLNTLYFGSSNELYIKYAQGLGFMDINPGSMLYLHTSYIALNAGVMGYNITGHTNRFYFSSGIDVSGTVVDTSDIRLKENIVNVTASIEDIANARIVDFNYKDKNETEFGAIAQDWQSIFPHAIREVGEDGMLGMNYGAIAIGSAVIAAREIVALKQRIALLEASLNQ